VVNTYGTAVLDTWFPVRRVFQHAHRFIVATAADAAYNLDIGNRAISFNNKVQEHFTLHVVFFSNSRITHVFLQVSSECCFTTRERRLLLNRSKDLVGIFLSNLFYIRITYRLINLDVGIWVTLDVLLARIGNFQLFYRRRLFFNLVIRFYDRRWKLHLVDLRFWWFRWGWRWFLFINGWWWLEDHRYNLYLLLLFWYKASNDIDDSGQRNS